MSEENEQDLSKKERQELKKEERENKQMAEKNKKRLYSVAIWSFIILFVGGTIGLMIYLASNKKNNITDQFVGGSVKAPDATDWVTGAPLKDAKVVLTEYGDFQCPACGIYYPLVKKIGADFKNITIVFRNFPLSQHKNAWAAAQAAGAAGLQGKFWEMHDLLYENQETWAELSAGDAQNTFTTYAQKLGLNMDKFKTDFDSAEVKTKIQADYQSGVSEIDGTPTFFLNNQKIQNPQGYDEFRNIIQQADGTL